MECRNSWHKKDWRKIKEQRTKPHLCVRWFHWSWRPRLFIHYWSSEIGEMRYTGIYKKDK